MSSNPPILRVVITEYSLLGKKNASIGAMRAPDSSRDGEEEPPGVLSRSLAELWAVLPSSSKIVISILL